MRGDFDEKRATQVVEDAYNRKGVDAGFSELLGVTSQLLVEINSLRGRVAKLEG